MALPPGRAAATHLPPAPVALTALTTTFNTPIGIDTHEPTNKLVLSVNYPSGAGHNFELVAADGSRNAFSSVAGLTDEVKIATVRSGTCQGGFNTGELFVGTGVPGQIARIGATGTPVLNPWVTLPGETGLMRGSLFQDRYCVAGGDLIAVTTTGGVWRVTSSQVPTKVAQIGAVHLEGVSTIPNDARYGPWAGKILAGAEGQSNIHAVNPAGGAGAVQTFQVPRPGGGFVQPEDIDIVPPNENFFGVNYGAARIMGAPASAFVDMVGDILIAQEFPGNLYNIRWDGTKFNAVILATVPQWEHVTFSKAGVVEIPPAAPPFSVPGSLPPDTLGARLCLPPYMDQNIQKQYWWARAAGGSLSITPYAVAVNPAETGTLVTQVFTPGGAPAAPPATMVYPATGETAGPPTLVAGALAGDRYRMEARVTPPPSGMAARHYRFVATGATLLGTNSPLPPQSEGGTVGWKVAVAAGEPLDVLLTPGPEDPVTTGAITVRRPDGSLAATVPVTPAGATVALAGAGATPGLWTVSVSVDHHYILSKTSGGDRGLYLAWDSYGFGSLSATVTRNGAPNTTPVTLELYAGGVLLQSFPGVTDSALLGAKLPVGMYEVHLAGATPATAAVTCDGAAAVALVAPNTPPDAVDDSATTTEETPTVVAVRANDSDGDGDTLTVTAVTQGTHGSVSTDGATVTYTPNPNFFGTDTFTYTISDGHSGTDTATVTVTVTPVNDPPVALADTGSTDAGVPVTVSVLLNDTDIDGDTLSIVSTTAPANGSIIVNADGTITYTPNAGFAGTDTFTYTVSDGHGEQATATVTITVNQVATESRMTGGGTLIVGSGRSQARHTWGFELRCDGSRGNLEYNNHDTGGRFHLEAISSVVCRDDPAVTPTPPAAPFDTLTLTGSGRWNNRSGYTIRVTLVDAGEPGRLDSIALEIRDSGGALVVSIAGTLSSGGNHQAHR